MADFVIVPIDVAALVVGAGNLPDNTGFAPPMTRFDLLPYAASATAPFNSEIALNEPPLSPESATRGVRVHWAMPDALMHATRPTGTVGGEWTFPSLPDMWLVTRVARASGKADVVNTWVVDSRFVSSDTTGVYNVGSRAVPWENANDPAFAQPPFRWLGRAVPLDDWQRVGAAGDHVDRLHAGSFGMVELAAYYPNVVNVFGIFDELGDELGDLAIDTGVELCYAVTGWHSRAVDDPLAGKTLKDAIDKLKAMKWTVDVDSVSDLKDWKTAVDLSEAPAGTAYCGVVHSINWATPAIAAPSNLTAAFGNTTSEALSALIIAACGAQPGEADALEFQLHTLLTSQLPVLADTAGQRLVTRQLHKQRFSPVTATSSWYVRRSSDGADVSAAQSEALRAQLDSLNTQQAAVDTLRNAVQERRWQIYADWLKYLQVKYGNDDGLKDIDPDQVASFMTGGDLTQTANDFGFGGTIVRSDAPLPEFQAKAAILTSAEGHLQSAHAALAQSVAALPPPANAKDITYTLEQKPGEVFFQPSDPTVLLAGNDVVPALRYGGDGLYSEDGTLACRTTSSLVSALSAPAGAVASSPAGALDARDSPGFGAALDAAALAAAPVARGFLVESMLLWPAWAAAKLSTKSGGDALAWQSWVQQQETAFLGSAASAYQGRKPSPVGIDAWNGNPWLPIMLHWEIDYAPTQLVPHDAVQQPTFDPKLILSRLLPDENDSLDSDATELMLTGGLSDIPTSYLGVNFITPHAGYAAFKTLNDFATANPDSPLAKLAAELKPMPLLSQALTGFHDRFLLRKRTLQLDVRDPFDSGDPVSTDFISQVVDAVGAGVSHANTTAPMVQDSFCPVRAGSLVLKTVWLVDAFGQYRRFQTNDSNVISTIPARSISPARMHPGVTATAFMPPRISQPALLRFNWLSANSDSITTGTQPSSTPICGWLVPNYLDESLMAYDADGTALGSVTNGVHPWIGAPSNPSTFGETAPNAKNPHLLDFLNRLIAKGPDYLVQFLDTLNAASATIQPLQHAQSAQIPVLVGQPLALVRASIALNLMSPPAINNNWGAFRADLKAATVATDPKTPRTTNGHESVQFPVLVGSVDDPDDGLLGFYLDSDFDTFHSVVADDSGIPHRKIDTVTVSAAGGAVVLSMIVDPRCDIHATTGYMPTQSLRIPAAMFSDAFANIAVTFLTAPVLTAAQAKDADPAIALPLPLPGQQQGQWSWLSVKGTNGGPRHVEKIEQVSPVKPGAPFSDPKYVLQEGWLSLKGFEQ